MLPFRKRLTLEQRQREYARVVARYGDTRVPVVLERGPSAETPHMDREKFIVPCDLTVAQLLFVVRKRMRLTRGDALFLLHSGCVVSTSATLRELKESNRNATEDGFLYLTYTTENAFG